ncbi:hypothetical protein DSO57_1009268 [Entomophthora muscae]|uniref:Uncharacterized protein n=1 Tax=Entomophthora muscae TaxID=34485 RepID=A0ACC2UGA9_9FUNG|nr:hypothetical protein DSO57_1009268 [Entomophthora muscae]
MYLEPVGSKFNKHYFISKLVMRVLCVAEKPSQAKEIAYKISDGSCTNATFRSWISSRGTGNGTAARQERFSPSRS